MTQIEYCICGNFRWLKISPMAHTLYCDKNFANVISPSAQAIQEVVGWPIEAQCVCWHEYMWYYMWKIFNVSKFSLCENIRGKHFCQQHSQAKLAKIFSWRKFPLIQYIICLCWWDCLVISEHCSNWQVPCYYPSLCYHTKQPLP